MGVHISRPSSLKITYVTFYAVHGSTMLDNLLSDKWGGDAHLQIIRFENNRCNTLIFYVAYGSPMLDNPLSNKRDLQIICLKNMIKKLTCNT